MNSGKIKNIIIIILCILAVYQTSELWFENISSRNFFYTFFSTQNKTASYGGEYNFATPFNIVVGFGNKNFNKFFVDKQSRILNDKMDECMKYMVSNGEYVETGEVNWNELLESKVVISNYSTNIPMSAYVESMGSKSSQTFSSKQKTFDTLALIPARNTGEYLKAYFINTPDNTVAVFSYKKNKLSDNLYTAIEDIQKQSNNISYVSTYQSEFNIFEHNIFLPQIADKDIVYTPIQFYNPYEVMGEISLQSIERYINVFFENPVAKWGVMESNNAYMYSDENVVVRYYPSGLLEYANYSVDTNDTDNSLLSAFNAAIELMQRDTTTYNRMYLSSMSNIDDTWKFGFDYYTKNFPVLMSDDLKLQLGIEHALEITVNNGIAIGYKHYVCRMELAPEYESKTVSIDFSTVLDDVMSSTLKSNINEMYLSYIMDGNSKNSDLMWIVNSNRENHIRATK